MMATCSVPLPLMASYPPDDTVGSKAAQLQITTTSDATDPQARWLEALFDKDTNEHLMWAFVVPVDYVSTPVLKVHYMANATTGDVIWGCQVLCVTDGDAASVRARKFAAANEVTVTVPGTQYYPDVASISIANADSMTAGDHCVLCLYRHADDGADTLAVDGIMYDCELQYANA